MSVRRDAGRLDVKPDLKTMFPKGSKSFFEANNVLPIEGKQKADQKLIAETLGKIRVPKAPNKTEAEYGRILEAMKRRGEILRYEYVGITLRWADMRYTPDFVVFLPRMFAAFRLLSIKLIEIKGGHIWDRDIVRFKGARAYWPEFQFEMHQKKGGIWTRIY